MPARSAPWKARPEMTGVRQPALNWLISLPHEPVIKQVILIKHAGKSYEAWNFYKRDYAANSERQGKPINILCNLDKSPSDKSDIFGIFELR